MLFCDKDGNIVTPQELKANHPNTSFPLEFTKELLAEYGLFHVEQVFLEKTKRQSYKVREKAELVNGNWTLFYDVVNNKILPRMVSTQKRDRLNLPHKIKVTGIRKPIIIKLNENEINLLTQLKLLEEDVTYRDNTNVEYKLTAKQVNDLWKKACIERQKIVEASWKLKNMDQIPFDFDNDKWW